MVKQSRRRFLGTLGLVAAGPSILVNNVHGASDEPLRFGLTAVFLHDRTALLEKWKRYLEQQLDRPVAFVRRASYEEITTLLLDGELDVAWICGYPFVRHESALRLVVVPLFQGEPLYRSYLIVPSTDSATESIVDLRGGVFAFSDPDSNSGYLYRRFQLERRNLVPDAFFRRTFFAKGHRNVIEAVAVGLADGGSVDGYVWETLKYYEPELVKGTRVASRSPQFGHPPIVARTGLSESVTQAVRDSFVQMPETPAGRDLLNALNLDGFARESPDLFASITEMMRYIEG